MVRNLLKALWRAIFSGTSLSSTSEPALPATVELHEPITRFLRHSSYFNEKTGRIKHEGLLPPPPNPAAGSLRYETSVYRAEGASSAELWAVCSEYVDGRDARMKARGTVEARAFIEQQLAFDPDGKPHRRHANVIGWPADKHARKNLAREVADRMTLEMRPGT